MPLNNIYKVIINFLADGYGDKNFQSMYIVVATSRDKAKKSALENFGNSYLETIGQVEIRKIRIPKNGVISGPHRP